MTPPRAARTARPNPHRAAREILAAHLRREGLKHSRQRDTIVEVFLSSPSHVSVEELAARARAQDPEIGLTTVYRTMKLLTECGVAVAQRFGDRELRYEPHRPDSHHDHLVCDGCGAVQEFEDEEIEQHQRAIARRHGFVLDGHRFELHGRCAQCRSGKRS